MPSRRALTLIPAAVLIVAAGACRPVAPPPPPPPLPTAPSGVAANPTLVDLDPDPAHVNEQVHDAPDPFVLAVDPTYCDSGSGVPAACYYAYTTQVYFNLTPVYRSSDLVHWELGGYDVPGDVDDWPNGAARGALAPWAAVVGHWSPTVLYRPGSPGARFVMWYSAVSNTGATAGFHCLGVAVADSPDGPFVDTSTTPAYCQTAQGGTIDPSPFVDTNGTPYLTYKTEGAANVPTRLWVAQVTADGRSLASGTERLHLEVDRGSGSWENPIIEGPTMARTPAGLFLFYSAYHWETASYKIGVARCDAPSGPCRRVYRTPLVGSRSAMWGPGGQTPFADARGQWHLAFHAWVAPNVGYGNGGIRMLRILSMTFPGGNPAVG